ncbi:uncharacterized protein RJT21DRAFT_140766 [Scheffersomyces amazonensis]|uniref:uncharacterized protein n=1 Tax=Scheffersomyces amazonensis TaxID=1078765 RepID=UPI00315DE260
MSTTDSTERDFLNHGIPYYGEVFSDEHSSESEDEVVESLYDQATNQTLETLNSNGYICTPGIPFVFIPKANEFRSIPNMQQFRRLITDIPGWEGNVAAKYESLEPFFLDESKLQRDITTNRLSTNVSIPGVQPIDMYNCNFCDSSFIGLKYFNRHVKKYHPEANHEMLVSSQQSGYPVRISSRLSSILIEATTIDIYENLTQENILSDLNKDKFLSLLCVERAMRLYKEVPEDEAGKKKLTSLVRSFFTKDHLDKLNEFQKNLNTTKVFLKSHYSRGAVNDYVKATVTFLQVSLFHLDIKVTSKEDFDKFCTMFLKDYLLKVNVERTVLDLFVLSCMSQNNSLVSNSVRRTMFCSVLFFSKLIIIHEITKEEFKAFKQELKSPNIEHSAGYFSLKWLFNQHDLASPQTPMNCQQVGSRTDAFRINGKIVSLQLLNDMRKGCITTIKDELVDIFGPDLFNGVKYSDIVKEYNKKLSLRKTFKRYSNSEFQLLLKKNKVKNVHSAVALFKRILKIQELLYLLIIIGCGAPYRSPEILTMRIEDHSNSPSNVILDEENVVFRTTYSKNLDRHNTIVAITKYLNVETGQYLILYLHLTRHILLELRLKFIEGTSYTKERTNRHVNSDIDQDLVQEIEEIENEEEDLDVEDPIIRAANNVEYIKREYFTKLFISLNGRAKPDLGLSAIRNITKAYGVGLNQREMRQGLHSLVHSLVVDFNKVEQIISEINRMSNHSNTTALVNYGYNHESRSNVSNNLLQRKVCNRWYEMLTNHVTPEVNSSNIIWQDVSIADVKDAYLKVLNFPAREIQVVTTLEVLRNNSIAICLRTSEGKTATYGVASYLENYVFPSSKRQVSVVVVPFISLRFDILEHLKRYGVVPLIYEGTINYTTAYDMLIVQLELFSNELIETIEASNHMSVRRIIFEEAHFMYHQYRESKNEEIAKCKRFQMLFVSATYPKSYERELNSLINPKRLIRLESPSIVRPNIILNKTIVKREEEVAEIIKSKVLQVPFSIVILPTIRKVQEYHKEFKEAGINCEMFHSKLNFADKESVIEKVYNSELRVVIATTGFTTGLDITSLRYLIIGDQCYDAETLIQASGRTGRDGQASTVDLILVANRSKDEFQKKLMSPTCLSEVQNWSQELEIKSCTELKVSLCSVCRSNGPTQPIVPIEVETDRPIEGETQVDRPMEVETDRPIEVETQADNTMDETDTTDWFDNLPVVNQVPPSMINRSLNKPASNRILFNIPLAQSSINEVAGSSSNTTNTYQSPLSTFDSTRPILKRRGETQSYQSASKQQRILNNQSADESLYLQTDESVISVLQKYNDNIYVMMDPQRFKKAKFEDELRIDNALIYNFQHYYYRGLGNQVICYGCGLNHETHNIECPNYRFTMGLLIPYVLSSSKKLLNYINQDNIERAIELRNIVVNYVHQESFRAKMKSCVLLRFNKQLNLTHHNIPFQELSQDLYNLLYTPKPNNRLGADTTKRRNFSTTLKVINGWRGVSSKVGWSMDNNVKEEKMKQLEDRLRQKQTKGACKRCHLMHQGECMMEQLLSFILLTGYYNIDLCFITLSKMFRNQEIIWILHSYDDFLKVILSEYRGTYGYMYFIYIMIQQVKEEETSIMHYHLDKKTKMVLNSFTLIKVTLNTTIM